jgi:hypothetical protein
MKLKNGTPKTNVGCIAQCLSLCLRVLNEGVSIPGHDSRRHQMKILLAEPLIIFAAQTGKTFA